MTPDARLQQLYDWAGRALRAHRALDRAPNWPEPLVADEDAVRLYWMACGITYERDFESVIENEEFDALAKWLLGQFCDEPPTAAELEAGTAQGWATWPPEAHALADELLAAKQTRDTVVNCFECWTWIPKTCICEERQ